MPLSTTYAPVQFMETIIIHGRMHGGRNGEVEILNEDARIRLGVQLDRLGVMESRDYVCGEQAIR